MHNLILESYFKAIQQLIDNGKDTCLNDIHIKALEYCQVIICEKIDEERKK